MKADQNNTTSSSNKSTGRAASSSNSKATNQSASDVASTMSELGKNLLSGMTGSKEKMVETTADALHGIEQSVKKNPWAYIGGAVALGFTIGYFATRKTPVAAIATGAKELKDKIEHNINKVSEHLQ